MRNKIAGIPIRTFFVYLVLLLLFFEGFLIAYIPFGNYIDEFVSLLVVFVGLSLVLLRRVQISSKSSLVLLFSFLFVLSGLIGNYRTDYQDSRLAIFADILSCLKFIIVSSWFYLLLRKEKVNKIQVFFGFLSRLMIVGIFAFAFLNLFFQVGQYSGTRYGIRSFSFFLGDNGGYLSYFLYPVSICFLGSLPFFKSQKKSNLILSLLLLLDFCSTLQTRGIIFGLLIFFLFFLSCQKKKFSKPAIFAFLVLFCLAFFLIGKDKLLSTFSNKNHPRFLLFETGFNIFMDNMPLGSGFATFGTAQSTSSYSKSYILYGLSSSWGFEPGDSLFTSDDFWPAVMGQTGLLGLICYIILLLLVLC